jgi:hypothetical protein
MIDPATAAHPNRGHRPLFNLANQAHPAQRVEQGRCRLIGGCRRPVSFRYRHAMRRPEQFASPIHAVLVLLAATVLAVTAAACGSSVPGSGPSSVAATEVKIVKGVVVESASESVSPATGYTVEDSGLTVDCYRGGETPHGPSTYQCGSNADGLYNCWLKRVTGWGYCLADPAGTVLRRITIGSVNDTSSKDTSADNPAALDLATGEHCTLRYGGSETPHPGDGKVPFYYCGNSGPIVWTAQGAGLSGIDRSKPQWQATVGTRTGPLSQVAVTRAWYTVDDF